jgi:hypothetical protein
MVSAPVAVPATVGSNCTSKVTASPALSVSGNVAPDIVKPAPLSSADLTTTAAFPVEVKVTGCIDDVLNVTFPNGRLVELIVNVGMEAFSRRPKLLETLASVAVSVAVCVDSTDETFAVNAALVAFAEITTVAGTITAALLLVRLTLKPLLPTVAVSVTMQVALPDPVMDALLQERELNAIEAAAA